MADLADAFLEGVFKTRQLNQQKEQFNAEQQFKAAQLNAENQRFQMQLGQQKMFQEAQDQNEKRRIQLESERNQQSGQAQAFSILAQGLGKEAQPLQQEPMAPQANQAMQSAPQGMGSAAPLGPAGAMEMGGHLLTPTSPAERMQMEQQGKLDFEHKQYQQNLGDLGSAISSVEKLTGRQVDPAVKAKVMMAQAAGPHGAAILSAIEGKPMSAENTLSDMLKPVQDQLASHAQAFITAHPGEGLKLLSDPQFVKTVQYVDGIFERLKAAGAMNGNAYRESVRLDKANSLSALNTAMAASGINRNDPDFPKKLGGFLATVSEGLRQQGRILDPDAQNEFIRGLNLTPAESSTMQLMNAFGINVNQQAPPAQDPNTPMLQTSPGQVGAPIKRGN